LSKFGYISVILAILAASLWLLLIGESVNLPDVLALFDGTLGEGKKTIILEVRIPRILMAILIGVLLASSGVVTQSVFLNPLADPYIIGIASSATFGAVIAYLLKLDDIYYGVFAFIASAILSFVIFSLYKKSQSIATLLIIGIAFSSFLGSFTSFASYLIGEESFKITAWMMGYLGSASWKKLAIVFVPTLFTFIYFYMKRYELNILLSGDEEAKTLGIDAARLKKKLLLTSALAVSFSVAFTGMIGFVGLIIPHILRMLLRTSSNVVLIPASALVGALFLMVCDGVAKSILHPIEIPIGVITSFFGAPFFLFLALNSRKGL